MRRQAERLKNLQRCICLQEPEEQPVCSFHQDRTGFLFFFRSFVRYNKADKKRASLLWPIDLAGREDTE